MIYPLSKKKQYRLFWEYVGCLRDDVRIIMNQEQSLTKSKRIDYRVAEDPNAPSTLNLLSGEAHANRRRLWNRGMSNDSLNEYEMHIAERASQLGEQLSERLGEAVDLSKWISCLASVLPLFLAMLTILKYLKFRLDIMGDMA